MAKKPTVTTIASGYASTTTLNNNFEALREGFDNTLSLDGSTPNAMQADLDMDGNDILDAGSIIVGGQDLLAATQANLSAAAVAQAAADAAVTAAETSETNAATSATSASTSASSAATSASQAASSALAASGSATASATSALAAENAETGAETAETNAQASALAALASEIAAAASETGADADRVAAQAAATAAAASETAAATSETNAATSETNAANSATASASSATASAASATAASASENAADLSAIAAAASETAAGVSETNAAASETAAAASETAAASSASSASTSASNAASSASSASASADAALAALDNFDDRYLGQKASDPTLDNDGDALVAGALYFNTTDDVMKVYEGSVWVAAYASLSGALLVANNLSDLASASAGRTNLGLGTGDSPTFAGLTTTGNVSFGDSDKAIFGAGSDLQIYAAGGNSFIQDTGSGSLFVTGASGMYLQNGSNETYLDAFSNGAVRLFHDNAQKLSTTSTGIDVTGTVTADGLTVDGELSVEKTTGYNQVHFGGNRTDSARAGRIMKNWDSPFDMRIRSTSATGDTPIFFDTGSTNTRMQIAANGDISFYEDTGTTPKFFWDASAESLGIGTSSPTYASGAGVSIYNAGAARLKLGDSTSGIGQFDGLELIYDDAAYVYNREATPLIFGTNATERMRIDSSGNVGIGTSSPSATLTVEGGNGIHIKDTFPELNFYDTDVSGLYHSITGSGSESLRFNADAGNVGGNTRIEFFLDNSEAMRIDSSGNLLVGTTSGSDKVTVNGTVSATNFNTTSDATLKTNVETLTGSLDAVNALRGVSFDWIESGGSEVGFIAQEVEEVLPEVVSTNDQGIKSVKYGNMVAVLVEAIKEQQLRIEALEAKLEG